jgi:spore germination protein KA
VNVLKTATVSTHLDENLTAIRAKLGQSLDLICREFTTGAKLRGLLVCFDGLADGAVIVALIEEAIRFTNPPYERPAVAGDPVLAFKETICRAPEMSLSQDLDKAIEFVLMGQAALFLEGSPNVLLIDARHNPGRQVEEPATEAEVRGPRDGMVENLIVNTTLIRRRIRDHRLRFDAVVIGERTRTDVAVAYIADLAGKDLVAEVKRRLQSITIDAVHGSGTIEELIRDSPHSPFTTMLATERPDKVCAALLEGRVAIIVDNSPFVLVAPATFWQYLQAPGDYYLTFWAGSALRLLRSGAMLIALTLPSMYTMLTTFHHEMIPTPLALSMAGGREGTPLPTLVEVLAMEVMFEIMQEAGLRLPRAVGQTVSIVGALVIGEAAVQAGLVSPATVIVIATAGITGFAIPSYSVSMTIRLLRFPLLMIAGTLGVFGFLAGTAILALHVTALRSFGVPFLAPVTPVQGPELGDTLIRVPMWKMNRRPSLGLQKRSVRQAPDQMPQPPSKGGGRS